MVKFTSCYLQFWPNVSIYLQLLEAETARAVFQDNVQLCNEVTDRVVQHFVRCIETHSRHMLYLKFLQTIVKCEGNLVRKCQDLLMSEVSLNAQNFILLQLEIILSYEMFAYSFWTCAML